MMEIEVERMGDSGGGTPQIVSGKAYLFCIWFSPRKIMLIWFMITGINLNEQDV